MALVLWVLAMPLALRAGEPARVPSPIEAAFSARADTPLEQFGHDLFPGAGPAAAPPPLGAVRGDYRLGIGDELLITLRGQQTSGKRHRIDGEGRLLLDALRPLVAAGRTLEELRAELSAAMADTHMNVEVFVSLAEVRRISVTVVGAVARPGPHELTAFASVLDGLYAAGGVTRAGSLRRIRLVQPGGVARTIDLYGLLLGGTGAEEPLRDGDRLVVPPLGATVAAAGPLKRPAVFELAPDHPRLSLDELIELAGGLLRPGAHRALRLAIGRDGAELADEVKDASAPLFGDGDLLLLSPRNEDRRGVARLDGHVLRPGPRALAEAPTLRSLVSRTDLGPEPYLPFAALAGTDAQTRARVLRPVDLGAVLVGRDDRALADGDALYILGARDVEFLTSEAVLALLRGARTPPPGSCQGLVVLARALSAEPEGALARGPQAQAAARMTGGTTPCPPLFEAVPDLLTFAIAHSALLRSGVPRPGFYPTAGKAGVSGLARAAGGAFGTPAVVDGARSGGRSSIAGRGDIVESVEPRVELTGHVRHPGVRPLEGGGTLRHALADGEALRPGVYPLLGVVERHDKRTLSRTLIPFSPQEVAAGRADRLLADGDRIHLFEAARVRAAVAPATGDPRDAVAPAHPVPPASPAADSEPFDPAIAALLIERTVQVRGAVRQPGAYPVADSASVDALLAAAGGLANAADAGSVELTTPAGRHTLDLRRPGAGKRAVAAGDALRVNPAFATLETRAVTILGEVRRPGAYDVLRGETLSSLIARAGGLTEEAYPAGAHFTRESERRREKERYQQAARELDNGIVLLLQKGDPIRQEEVALARQLSAQLRGIDPPGRMVVEADPAVLRQRPELDVLLESDDRILIPKRPLTVAVAGEVMAPAALQFQPGKTAADYLREAGGPTRGADDGRAFLVLPDGRAQPLSLSSWNHTVAAVPPGSTIVVPRDPKPFDTLEFTRNLGGILGSLAITAASISVIGR
ncbi:MAG TPA: SLBB domain-containing protein [Azospirillum sp.]|nr:SLBB domain-containing protein [Azospirillum sp.]